MLFKSLFSIAAVLFVGVAAQDAKVFTATRVYKTLTDVAPFIVTATSTSTWTYVLQARLHCSSKTSDQPMLSAQARAPRLLSPPALESKFRIPAQSYAITDT
ncbi:hypothetical protein C8R43DRAFT_1242153 [Mycena crocata]|nr:hypothetical protein C8R43DRAFT_1242153 [Mycena crocata]